MLSTEDIINSMDDPINGSLFPIKEINEELSEKLQKHISLITAAYAYERKGYVSFDAIDRERSKSYGRDDDAIVLNMTVVVQSYDDEYHEVKKIADKMREKARQEAIAEARSNYEKFLRQAETAKEVLDHLESESN